MTPSDIGALARRALEVEVRLTPKPGLVDSENNGAHRDMDLSTFLRSAEALEPWFTRLAQAGYDLAGLPPAQTLPPLRKLGKQAEGEMYAATGGVNTHKGALFSLGLLCAGAGRCVRLGETLSADRLCALSAEIVRGITARELTPGADSHGLAAYARYGAQGVRGEAEGGFPAVRELALPHLLSREGSGEERALKALLALISRLWDTNVLHRAGEEGLCWLQGQARAVLDDFSLPALRALDRECIRRNISPGGSADLLAIALFLRDIERTSPVL